MIALNFTPFPVLKTERLIIRQLTDDDVDVIYRLRTEHEVIRYIARGPYTQKAQAIKFIEMINQNVIENKSLFWGITLKDGGQMIGTACIWNINKQDERAEIGYDLLPEYRSKGFMTEAITEVIKYGFEEMKLHSLEANINPANNDSIKLAERVGFVKEAHYKEHVLFDGAWRDTCIYSLLVQNFRAK